jgi:hypothetical protein
MENQTSSDEQTSGDEQASNDETLPTPDPGVGLSDSDTRVSPEWSGGHELKKPPAESVDPEDVRDLAEDEKSPAEPENS